jgi:hypothetical protein
MTYSCVFYKRLLFLQVKDIPRNAVNVCAFILESFSTGRNMHLEKIASALARTLEIFYTLER